jgi:Nucleotidyl transferase of unknown function (DUF2204)
MKLSKDLREFIGLLNSKGIKFIIVGGHAVAYHGYPRFTGDIDFFIECSSANAKALERVINAFGFAGLGLTANDFLKPETVIQLGRPRTASTSSPQSQGLTSWAPGRPKPPL